MKIALAQLNYMVADFEGNLAKILVEIEKAKSQNVDILAFSELAICGYPPHDLLERREFIETCLEYVDNIATHCTDIAVVIGAPSINANNKGKRLYNSAFFLCEGKVQQVFNKTLLPTYDVFDEYRYFEPNSSFELLEYKGKKIAITICEDIWENQPVANPFLASRLYALVPMEQLAPLRPDFMINIAASPFSYVQAGTRKRILKQNAEKYHLDVFYVNQVGAHTELVFDGLSMAVNRNGELVAQAKQFEEDTLVFDTENLKGSPIDIDQKSDHIPLIYNALVLGIRDYFGKMNFTKAVLGLSGGIDSALVAALAVDALGAENVRGVLMPSQYSSDHSVTDAVDLANNLGMQYDIVPIKSVYNQFVSDLNPLFGNLPFNVAEENIQARVRGTLLMAVSNKFGNILLNTTNKSEAAVGYGTLYGDMNGGLAVLGDVYKTDVFKLCYFINRNGIRIPENTISKPPSAELRPNQKDSDSLPEYDILDGILFNYIELNRTPKEIESLGYASETVAKTIRLVNINEYKRFQAAPILRVSSKAFGFGRRMPLVAKY